ncbi:Crp/Fnr family transcriptional regulator [Flagellimonas flava]|uniref:CRP/FNR family transcriptional regulator, anaerobic regulatory protein n=1 Tax=Flagellimonas flava TaxID=570519 RepID=A0A1M5PD74_9FLAO|nr:Crp/Fnr family transcriptional regulator [Allomuricauda flava]SHG99751.1 CRP/FNR family transcriptional regulator, anaerobic regulatory protein [Allomuricauda flava]
MTNENHAYIKDCFPVLEERLFEEIKSCCTYHEFASSTYVVKQGAYLNFLPVVLKGQIKMFAEEEDVQFLLYYINSGESCILSFNHLFDPKPIQFSAITEEDTLVMTLPVNKVKEWFIKYPTFARILINDYQRNFEDLLRTTKEIVCYGIEERLLNYLIAKSKRTNSSMVHLSHSKIAMDLGTSREVISRTTKKLEKKGILSQHKRCIELLDTESITKI